MPIEAVNHLRHIVAIADERGSYQFDGMDARRVEEVLLDLEDAQAEADRFRAALEVIAEQSTDKLKAMQARCALDNIGPPAVSSYAQKDNE